MSASKPSPAYREYLESLCGPDMGGIAAPIYEYLTEGHEPVVDVRVLMDFAKHQGDSFARQFMRAREDRAFRLMASNHGKCPRRLSYDAMGCEKEEPFSPRSRMNFWLGDILEGGVTALAKLAGTGLRTQSEPVEVVGFEGRAFIDGKITFPIGWADNLDAPESSFDDFVPVEVKKMTDYPFQTFVKEGLNDMWGYQAQLQSYMRAINAPLGVAVAVNALNGHLADFVHMRDDEKYLKLLNTAQHATTAGREGEPVERPDWTSLKTMPRAKCWEIEGARCGYCDHTRRCWADKGEVFVKVLGNGPKYRIPFPPPENEVAP